MVHAISHCIEVLESPVPDKGPAEITKVEALRLLVHFVGDIHQPLHCGTGFYQFSAGGAVHLITDPQTADGKPNDRGGNLLFYGQEATDQLHALWDRVLVEKVDSTMDYRMLADFLTANYVPKDIPRTEGDYHKWAERWAIESVEVAKLAYQGVTCGIAEFGVGQQVKRIPITLAKNYIEINKPRAAAQMTRAGAHLAQLLDNIRWHVQD